MMDAFSYVVTITIFLTCFTLLIAGIIDAARENKRIDRERKAKESLPL
jgi:hypothetical protein